MTRKFFLIGNPPLKFSWSLVYGYRDSTKEKNLKFYLTRQEGQPIRVVGTPVRKRLDKNSNLETYYSYVVLKILLML